MSNATNLKRRRLHFLRRRRRERHSASMTMMEHLGELRTRIVVSAAVFAVLSTIAFVFYEPILEFFKGPLCEVPPRLLGPEGCDLTIFKVTSGFTFRLKLTALVGLAASSPVWLYQIYAFVLPALTPRERRYTWPFIISTVTLFLVGSSFAYLAMPTGVRFLLAIGGQGLTPLLGAEEYLNFVGLMMLGFGLTFELPLLLVFLGLVGVVTVDQLRSQRRVAIVVITLIAAVVTPSQDPYTMLVLAVPLYLLYEVTILILRLAGRNKEQE